jgi:hypothetical protein
MKKEPLRTFIDVDKLIKIIYSLIFLLTLISCNPAIHLSVKDNSLKPMDIGSGMLIVDVSHSAPDGCKLIAKLKTGGNVFSTGCGYDDLVMAAKAAARKVGGNVVKITQVSEPDVHNSCYRLKADILYCKNIGFITAKLSAIQDSITKTKFPVNPNYALLYVYRTEQPEGYERGYNLHLNDSVICRVNKYCKQEIKLYKKGMNALWAETEVRDSVLIDVKFGEEYFLKCTLKMGIIIGRPDMELIPKEEGRYEYEHAKGKDKFH